MKTVQFERMLAQLGKLSHQQRNRLAEALARVGHENQAVGCIEAHFASAPVCPHCNHGRIYLH